MLLKPGGRTREPRIRCIRGRACLASGRRVFLLISFLSLLVLPAVAQGQLLTRPLQPADGKLLDLISRTTRDPDLLTARQAAMQQKLIYMGIDPIGKRERPSISTLLRLYFADSAGQSLFQQGRQVEILEVDWKYQQVTVYRYPEIHLFFTEVDTNEVGIAFESPRAMTDSLLSIEMDSAESWRRHWVSIGLQDKWWQQLQSRKAAADAGGDLLNFTIKLKLPRTLERVIGKGEATNIRISGQETISIAGESTRRSDFMANEIQQSQSLFPKLEMKQTLRVTLDGTVGEKIKVRVTHDSEAVGTQGTEVKLSFEGDEDDIIQTIRAGNIDVTLPGSRLLGVGASKGGLFGVKVEGAVGPLSFTVVTSKEQSQENKATFNQSGGTEESFAISSTQYIKNRFFRLNAPYPLFMTEEDLRDESAFRFQEDWEIDLNTLELYVSFTQGISDENTFEKGYAFVDTRGDGWENADDDPALFDPVQWLSGVAYEESPRWRRLQQGTDWNELLDDSSGEVIGIALNRSLNDGSEILAAAYNIIDGDGVAVRRVGRRAGSVDPYIDDFLTGEEGGVHFFKLIKPRSPEDPAVVGEPRKDFDLCWEYMYRHYYDLKGREIEPATLKLEIQRDDPSLTTPQFDGATDANLPWFQVFGLDQINNQSGQPEHDNQVDVTDAGIFNLFLGVLQFRSATPFDPSAVELASFTDNADYPFDEALKAPDLYRKTMTTQEEANNRKFNLVVTHTSTSSRFRLNAFNIKQGSEEVTLDGRVLQRDKDYSIDYFSGEINLIDQPLDAQSNIQVRYEVDPLFGGGRTSLQGINLAYKLNPRRSFTTTWLLQSKPNNATKPRLGEEPSRNLVGNFAAKLQFSPSYFTTFSNLISRKDSDQAPNLNLDGEIAISVPNPNTAGQAYLEDFETVDESNNISLSREGWFWATLPAEYLDDATQERRFSPENRAYAGWHRPVPGVNRGDLNPDLSETEKRDVLSSMELRVVAPPEEAQWRTGDFAGIIRSLGGELDLTQAQFLEFWLNDYTGDGTGIPREGKLHFDFGIINEDFWWPYDEESLQSQLGSYQLEDTDNDGMLRYEEDTGLDGIPSSAETRASLVNRPGVGGDPAGDDFSAEDGESNVFLYINGTENNQRLDSEDLNRDGVLEKRDGYYSLSMDLADMDLPVVDIYRDYDAGDYGDFISESLGDNLAWRKYRLDLSKIELRQSRGGTIGGVEDPYSSTVPDLSRIRYLRIWYENPEGLTLKPEQKLVFTEMRFLGNRWQADGLRDADDQLLGPTAGPFEDFRVGVINNKENPDYEPPVSPDVRNSVAEKEQSLQFLYSDLESGHQLRVRKDIPGSQGQDFSVYGELNFFWRAPFLEGQHDSSQDHLECFYWVGSDSTNYYEVAFNFEDVSPEVGSFWQECRVDLATMTNIKKNGREESLRPGSDILVRRGEVTDRLTGEIYRITVRGRPDLRRVRRYYAGLRHPYRVSPDGHVDQMPLSGEVLFNEIRLKEVDRKVGYAKRLATSISLPGLGEISLDWRETDAEFRGLNQNVGSGVLNQEWSARLSSKLQNLIPLFGIDLPFAVSKKQNLTLPKFETGSDVELLTEEERYDERSEDESESFNLQIRKPKASRYRVLNFTLDRFTFSLSGTRSWRNTPKLKTRRKSADTKYNYDLRLPRGFEWKIPFTRQKIRTIPDQLTMGSVWRYDEQHQTDILDAGAVVRDPTVTKTVANNLSLAFSPVRTIRGNFSMSSNRNIVNRDERVFLGVNWGQEETHNERFSLTWNPEIRMLNWLKPTADISSSYQENRRPGVRPRAASTDPDPDGDGFLGEVGQVRNVGNGIDINMRGELKLLNWLQKRFKGQRRQTSTASRAQERRDRGRISSPGGRRSIDEAPQVPDAAIPEQPAQTDSTATTPPDSESPLEDVFDAGTQDSPMETPPPEESLEETDAEREARIQEEIRLQEQERLQADRERMEAIQRGEDPDAAATPEAEDGELPEDPRLDPLMAIRSLFRPMTNFILELQPIRASYQRQNSSSYQQVNQRADWAYRLGLAQEPAFPGAEDLEDWQQGEAYSNSQVKHSNRVSFNTRSQLSQTVKIDLNFSYNNRVTEGAAGKRSNYTIEWPSASLKITKVHEWPIFGDLFTVSNIDVAYKQNESASGVTDDYKTPKKTMTLSPRWTFRFQNGLDANLNMNYSRDRTETNLNELRSQRIRGNLKLQKNFDAEGRLRFLRFGRKGTGTTIDMSVDISYDRNKSDRLVYATGTADQPRGTTRLSVGPSFSYQFSKNFRGGLRLAYSRTKDLARDATTTSFSLGLNATLSF